MITVDNNITNEKVVLVVDDIFENLLILKRMLEKEGYKPLTASSAKDALEMVRVKEPQLILLDVYMPEMDGFELCEILKNDVKTKDIPIIFISGGMSKEDKIKGFKLGAVDFIADIANDMVSSSFDRANDLMLRETLGAFCGFWALCPDEDFESGVENIFGGHEEEYSVLLEKIDGVKEFVFSTEETLLKAKNNGVKISFVSNYNSGLTPVYEKANLNGDNVLEAELTSNFATIAPLGETLSKGYIENADKKYISPDNVIDASTAVFKDNTWFVKDAPHVAADYKTGFSEFTFTLLESETQPTVDTFEKYPQFMIADEFLFVSPLK